MPRAKKEKKEEVVKVTVEKTEIDRTEHDERIKITYSDGSVRYYGL